VGSIAIDGLIENLIGTNHNDVLLGNHVANRILGLAGHDILLGRLGDDDLEGGDGNDVLVGGEGDDDLCGGPGHDLLIGGRGRDRAAGDTGGDALVGGSTSHDDHVRALQALIAEWTARRPLEERIANLRVGANADRRNGFYFLDDEGFFRTVFADNVHDELLGNAETEWLIADSAD
jgi:Ca2+-binding RTX toxin-like protein